MVAGCLDWVGEVELADSALLVVGDGGRVDGGQSGPEEVGVGW